MKIISKIKDYYDYLQGIYGIDDLVVYDRRNCTPLKSEAEKHDSYLECIILDKKAWNDRKLQRIGKYSSDNLLLDRHSIKELYILEGKIYHFLLEIGFSKYLFQVERYLDEGDKVVFKHDLISTKNHTKKISHFPMAIIPCSVKYHRADLNNLDDLALHEESIGNPILNDTWISKYIKPKDVWENLYEYISSLNDKEIIDKRTDKEHIESNGFDVKSSFRGKIVRKRKNK